MKPMDHQANRRRGRWQRALALSVLMAGLVRGANADLPWGGTLADTSWWLTNAPQLSYLKTDIEVRRSSYRPATGPATYWDELTVTPALGITWNNFLYNPYLLNYTLLLEPGYYWQVVGTAGHYAKVRELMLNGSATFNLLPAKPYAVTGTYGRSHAEVQSDFFTSQTLDRESWGLLSGYRAGAVPFTVSVDQSRDDRSSDDEDYVTKQFKAGLHATNDRKQGDMTVFDYQFNRYDIESNSGTSGYSSESSSHRILLTDTERFATGSLNSSLNFNQRDSDGLASSDLNAYTNYNLALAPALNNYYTYSLTGSFADGYQALTNSVTAGLNHQLYESLNSHLDLHGADSTNDSAGANLRSSTCGIAVSVNYNKRLGAWGRLTFGNSVAYDLSSQESSGDELVVPDESYTIPAVGPMIIRLKTPSDVSITSITRNNSPLDPSEWIAIRTSDPWQIQFVSGGVHALTGGDAVVITYVVKPNPTGHYSTRSYMADIALRFWHEQAGVRASYMTTGSHSSSQQFVLQSITQYQLGADVGYGAFHADGSYNHLQSNLYSYQIRSLSESYSRPLSEASTLGVNFYQQWNDFPAGSGSSAQEAQQLEFYSYMARYEWRPRTEFNLSAEAGLQQQRGSAQDQNLFAVRVYFNWQFSKLEAHLGYEHENREYVADTSGRNYFFLRMRRNF
jgi:hypothetical protein